MARAKTQKPFDEILTTHAMLKAYVEYGDLALRGQRPQDFAADVAKCFGYLMSFRNIINGMVSFDETPERSVLPYLPDGA